MIWLQIASFQKNKCKFQYAKYPYTLDKSSMIASVIVYTYQRRDFIIGAVNSLLKQTIARDDFEIIVVKAFQDEKIDAILSEKADKVLYVNEKAHGKKLTAGIRASSGDYLFFMDDDDEFDDKKLEVLTRDFISNTDVMFIHNSINKIDINGNGISESVESVPRKKILLDTSKIDSKTISAFFRFRANWYSSCMAFRRDVLASNLDTLDKVYQSVDPFMFLCALNHKGKMALVPDRLTRYRVHTSTTNYRLEPLEYLQSKEIFYRRSAEIIEMSLAMANNNVVKQYVSAYLQHNRFMSQLLNLHNSRGTTFRNLISYLPVLNRIFVRYFLLWVVFGLFKFMFGSAALRLYYWFSTRNA